MKAKEAKELIKSITERGWVKQGDVYHPPGSATEVKKVKVKKQKSVISGWIDDHRNLKNKENSVDPFIMLIKKEFGLTVWPEFYFSTERKYRLDYAIPINEEGKELKIAVEVQGGIWAKGNSGHSSGVGIKRDMDKSNLCQSLGWFLIKITPDELLTTKTLNLIKTRL